VPGCAVVAFLEAVCEGFPVVVCPHGGGRPGMVICPGVGGGEESVFVSDRSTCWRGGGGVEVVTELRSKWDGGCW
jgi:hypothetical protein